VFTSQHCYQAIKRNSNINLNNGTVLLQTRKLISVYISKYCSQIYEKAMTKKENKNVNEKQHARLDNTRNVIVIL